jgi:hypothetical protein
MVPKAYPVKIENKTDTGTTAPARMQLLSSDRPIPALELLHVLMKLWNVQWAGQARPLTGTFGPLKATSTVDTNGYIANNANRYRMT